jgi:hypothetical protein
MSEDIVLKDDVRVAIVSILLCSAGGCILAAAAHFGLTLLVACGVLVVWVAEYVVSLHRIHELLTEISELKTDLLHK